MTGASGTAAGADALSRLWREVVSRHGGRPALTDGRRTLTYRQLDLTARAVAGRLVAAGAGPGRYVMLGALAPLDAVVGMLGALAAGAAFAVLEDDLPEPARAARCARVDAALLVGRGAAPSGTGLPPWVDLSPELDGPAPQSAGGDPGDRTAVPAGPAYAMFTSGSTGEPKAVGIGRDALHGFALAAADRLALGPGDRWLQLASLGFDVVVEEVFPVLARGGTVVCRPGTAVPDPQELHALLGDLEVTVVELSTQYWREYAHWLDVRGTTTPPALRRVLVGGERMDPDDWRRWERAGRAALVHVYGLTECTVTSTMYQGPLADAAAEVPVGTPLANAEVNVRGPGRHPVAPGEVGEIHIGGPSLASGYLGDPEQTARRFVTGPRPGDGRLYATGDLGRVLPDGNVEFHGRVDDQMKIRGHRLEPASVERLLAADPSVAQAVVLADARTRSTLLACLVPAGPAPTPPPDGVLPVTAEQRARLLARVTAELPGWAAPQRLFWTGALPKNAHGKVDRRGLAARLATESRAVPGPDTAPGALVGVVPVPGAPANGALASGASADGDRAAAATLAPGATRLGASASALGASAVAPGATGLGASAPAPGASALGLGASAPAPGASALGLGATALGASAPAPAPGASAPAPGASPVPASVASEPLPIVLRRFRDLLDDPEFGVDADFFAGGGQSILAMRLVTELRADFPGTVGLRATTVFDHPTPRRLAHWLSAAQTRPRSVSTPFPPAAPKEHKD